MDLVFVLSFIFSILFFIFYLHHFFRIRAGKTLPTPPGSTGLPFIGETLDFLSAGRKGTPEVFVKDRIKKYSSTIFKTSLLGQSMVVVCNPDGNKFIFSNENKLVKSWWPRSLDVIFGTPQSVALNEESMRVRKFLAPYFKPDALQKYVGIMDSATKEHLRNHWDGKEIVTVHPFAKHYTFSLVCRLFLGLDDKETVARLEKPFAQLTSSIFTLPVNFPGTNFHRAMKASKELLDGIDVMIKQWKSDLQAGRLSPSQAVLEEILRETLEDEDSSTKILALLAAAYDNTSATLASVTMYLAQDPEVYDKVFAEQMEIARSKGPNDMLNWGDLQKMNYSWNVACEVLRLHPPVPGAFREAISNFIYNGFLIPKGWKLHWSTHSTHKNPEYFKEPEKFDPSRFEGNGPLPFSYVPFGGGPRMCPGKEYARLKILVYMHNVVTKFRWEKVFPDERIISDPLLKPAKGLPIRIFPYKF